MSSSSGNSVIEQLQANPHLALCDAAYHGDCDIIRSILSERENRYLVNEFLNFDEHMGEVCILMITGKA